MGNSSEREPYYGDLSKTGALSELFAMPADKRDDNWQRQFLDNVVDASFACGEPQVIQGPDGFPYFQINSPEPNKEFQCYVLRHMKDDFLLERGFGVVINAAKGQPDWVFSYGDIVNFHVRNEFYSSSKNWDTSGQQVVDEEEKVLVGVPSEAILPVQSRLVMREFLKGIGIEDCKVLLMHRSSKGESAQQLVFNLSPDKFEKEEHFQGVMRSLAWYLPRHYVCSAMKESIFGKSFQLL